MDLFDQPKQNKNHFKTPLADRIRAETLNNFVGQIHLLGNGKPLRILIESDNVPSMILWGPPGCGKTTLALIISRISKSDFVRLNAVSSGVQDIRRVISRSEENRKRFNKKSILFIDEIHRFNKSQQDALLNSVETGTITLIGATTENPSFEVIPPLLSRCQVYVMESLTKEELLTILNRALKEDVVLQNKNIILGDKEKELLLLLAAGDARVMLNGLENAVNLVKPNKKNEYIITKQIIGEALQRKYAKYDKGGEEHYNIISAFIKSIRGGDPDAAVYWLARMLEGGEDPKFIARRMIILASEDIGNAEPYALTLATSCFTAVDYVGLPEARIILSQTAIYLASAPKSNSSYLAIEEALSDVKNIPNDTVPLHLRNAPTKLMKDLHYGEEYKYSHNYNGHFVEQQYLPDNLKDRVYYHPSDIGVEKVIRKRLNTWWKNKKR